LAGGRISLTIGVLVGFTAMLVGVPLGLLSGYSEGLLDRVLTGSIDIALAFPALLLAIAIAAGLGPGLSTAIIAITVVEIPRFQRLARAQTLFLRELEYVTAAKAIGASDARVMRVHLLPNALPALIVQLSLTISAAILAEAGLSFLGLSVPPPASGWGAMLNSGRGYLEQAPWLSVFPGLAIMAAVLGFNKLGDGIRDALDPRLVRSKGP